MIKEGNQLKGGGEWYTNKQAKQSKTLNFYIFKKNEFRMHFFKYLKFKLYFDLLIDEKVIQVNWKKEEKEGIYIYIFWVEYIFFPNIWEQYRFFNYDRKKVNV